MTGFEPRTSGIGSDRSTNWATTTAQLGLFLEQQKINLSFFAENWLKIWQPNQNKILAAKLSSCQSLFLFFASKEVKINFFNFRILDDKRRCSLFINKILLKLFYANPGLFLVYIFLFSGNNWQKNKTWVGKMVGTDESTELWRHP